METVRRILVEKQPKYAVEADSLLSDIKKNLNLNNITQVRIFNRIDIMGVSDDVFNKSKDTIFCDPVTEKAYEQLPEMDAKVFAVEFLPGQYDQRADSCEQALLLLTGGQSSIVKTATVYAFFGEVSDNDIENIKKYFINPVESRESTLEIYTTLEQKHQEPSDVKIIDGFIDLDDKGLEDFLENYGLAMDINDVKMLRDYFKNEEDRNPTITEIRMIDTYWSDHCRHTTFFTEIENIDIAPEYIKNSYEMYLDTRDFVYQGKTAKPVTLMDLATVAVKWLKKEGKLNSLDESEEINACSVKIDVKIDGKPEKWLLMFKNETHNHPTEIEPFGGASTCLGGAIRDPLSGRSYVYQAMRITGSGDPRNENTLAGKLPQRKITTTAAKGYSSYGNQIGAATGYLREIYHEGYVAKRMECGAVIAAVPEDNVVRVRPEAGDVVLLIGGKTGRDGCGGATSSSKSHTEDSMQDSGAEVQKGNPIEERKIVRLFRNPIASKMIKRCNDFGAGGVSVAIGELADGLDINLDAVPTKYDGLDGTELAISESQERMAVVVSSENAVEMITMAAAENLQATPVAIVTDDNRLHMSWRNKTIVDISRAFLDTNGAKKVTSVEVVDRVTPELFEDKKATKENWLAAISDLNLCSQRGIIEQFDSTTGANTVLMPLGGKNQLTPAQSMVSKIPVLDGETNTCSMMAYGYDPNLSEKSPYHGAMYAVVESVAKLIAVGGDLDNMWLTFQEYFPRTGTDSKKWGLPFEALLGAMESQKGLFLGSIGGKDSMSGTFENLHVPPTLISFAVSVGESEKVVSPEFKNAGSNVFLIKPKYLKDNLVDFENLNEIYRYVNKLINQGKIKAAHAITMGGLCRAITEMCVGNDIGFKSETEDLFSAYYGGLVIETDENTIEFGEKIGTTISNPEIQLSSETISLDDLKNAWEKPLEDIFPVDVENKNDKVIKINSTKSEKFKCSIKITKPRVVIPVVAGTNGEYEAVRAFEKAGAQTEVVIIRDQNPQMIADSINQLRQTIDESQIIMLAAGVSGGNMPMGSGKTMSTFLKTPAISDSIMELLNKREGLILGIGSGFQALVNLGLLPFGEIRDIDENSPAITVNEIGRHQSKLVNTRVASVNSPWLADLEIGDIHNVPVSHGEGRFVANDILMAHLIKNGQIATQYVDSEGEPSMDITYNPNGSYNAVEGILSLDGRVFGKMGHSERVGEELYKNVPTKLDQKLFLSGIKYFS